MKRYTVGFVFDSALEKVLLIHKNRPEWQKGKLNGPGGKIEENETSHESISREIGEETGILIPPENWVLTAEIENEARNVTFFGAVHHGKKEDAQTQTDEKVEWVSVQELPLNVISNLTWLIPLCKDKIENKKIEFAKVRSED